MDARDLLTDGFGRIADLYAALADDLDQETLHHRPAGTGNPVAWLLWHLARVQDDHVAGLATTDQVWVDQVWVEWQERLGLPHGTDDIGYGHTTEEVDSVRITDPSLLAGYHRAVHQATMRYLDRADADELDRIVDHDWDPPVTAGARLVSVQGDCLQHLGQAAYVVGLLG